MPWITEGSKEIEHSWHVKKKYAQSAQAHREALQKRSVPLWPMFAAVAGLIAAYACVLYLLSSEERE